MKWTLLMFLINRKLQARSLTSRSVENRRKAIGESCFCVGVTAMGRPGG